MTFKERCIELRKQDHSLGEIVRITGRPKTSVYTHIHTIPLSNKKWNEIRARCGAHIRRFAVARKGKSERSFKKLRRWDENAIFIVSHILFDGDFNTGGFSYNNRSVALMYAVERAMKEIYSYEPKRYPNHITGVQRISYFNVALRAHVKKMSQLLLREVPGLHKKLQRIFLQAFFDDEGCVDYRPHKNKRSIRGFQKDVTILEIVRGVLANFDIEAKYKEPNEVVIVGKENLQKFQKEIGFSLGVCINGKRSNSIWKQSLEKREILKRAISSYKPIGSNGVHRSAR